MTPGWLILQGAIDLLGSLGMVIRSSMQLEYCSQPGSKGWHVDLLSAQVPIILIKILYSYPRENGWVMLNHMIYPKNSQDISIRHVLKSPPCFTVKSGGLSRCRLCRYQVLQKESAPETAPETEDEMLEAIGWFWWKHACRFQRILGDMMGIWCYNLWYKMM